MKQAFLITAYKDYESLVALAEYLSETSYVYIHVDGKSEITSAQIAKLNMIKGCHASKKYKICWGGFAHVSAILDLLGQAVLNEQVSYIHLLTGEDVPLLTMEEMDAKYLEDDHIYMDMIPESDFTTQVQKRIYYYNFFSDKNVKNPILWQLQNFTVNLQKLFRVKRKTLGEFEMEKIWKGLVYVSLPKAAAEYVVAYCEEHEAFLEDLKKCQIPEEFFFQTLIMNSGFASKVSDKSIRYMNWERGDGGSPAYLNMDDYERICKGDYAFARKFNKNISGELRNKLFDGELFPQ